MSFTTPEGVQPDPGQGTGGDAPYAEYLNRIPEELREQVDPVFRDWDAQTTRKFQEHSQFRQQWEPYQELGIDQWEPDSVRGLLEFGRVVNDPSRREEYLEWLRGEATQNGLLQSGEVEDDFDDDLLDPNVKTLIEQTTSPLLQQIDALRNQYSEFEMRQQQQAREAMWNSQFEELTGEHGELDRDVLQKFAAPYANDPENAIKRGFDDFQRMRAAIEQRVLNGKLNQPASPSAQPGAGLPGNRPKNADEAEQVMRQRLEQMGTF